MPNTMNPARHIRTNCFRFFPATETNPARIPANTNNVLKPLGIASAFWVLETVTVMGTGVELAVTETDDGFTLQVVPAGAPEQVSATVPLKPCWARLMLYVAVCPAVIVALVFPPAPERENVGGAPMTTVVGAAEDAV